MQQHKLILFGVSLLVGVSFGFGLTAGFAQEENKLTRSPLNPEFVKYLEDLKANKVSFQTKDRHGLGLIPSAQDLSGMKGQKVFSAEQMLLLPTSYDKRTTGKLTNVKDQGSLGNCWAFATFGSLESGLLWYSAESCDFSEQNLKNLMSSAYPQGYDFSVNSGGNYFMSAAYLSRWSGPLNQADDLPYGASSVSPTNIPARKHLQDMLILPDRSGPTDNDNIKTAVLYYGAAVQSSMYWDDAAYNPSNYAYYNTGSGSGHAVCIVGWDDTFARTKFNVPNPPGDGAFICRNSWGTSWGQAGYFYVSYYDYRIGSDNAVFLFAEPTTNYGKVYQYDPLGWPGGTSGYGDKTVAWGANIFTASSNDTIAAVSFYLQSPIPATISTFIKMKGRLREPVHSRLPNPVRYRQQGTKRWS